MNFTLECTHEVWTDYADESEDEGVYIKLNKNNGVTSIRSPKQSKKKPQPSNIMPLTNMSPIKGVSFNPDKK